MARSKLNLTRTLFVGCAGWSLPKQHAARFPENGTHLSRYAERLPAVEINSSFYRPHRPATYAKWAASVPTDFRFAVKVPREITHERRLANVDDALDRFIQEATALEEKLGPLLVQLPPSLPLSPSVAEAFFDSLRERFDGRVVLEPRHASWFAPEAEILLARYRVARAAADPAIHDAASEPGGWNELVYYRLHGSPKMYYSEYATDYVERLSTTLAAAARKAVVWCIFDNTAEGAATKNALDLLSRIQRT